MFCWMGTAISENRAINHLPVGHQVQIRGLEPWSSVNVAFSSNLPCLQCVCLYHIVKIVGLKQHENSKGKILKLTCVEILTWLTLSSRLFWCFQIKNIFFCFISPRYGVSGMRRASITKIPNAGKRTTRQWRRRFIKSKRSPRIIDRNAADFEVSDLKLPLALCWSQQPFLPQMFRRKCEVAALDCSAVLGQDFKSC